MIAVTRNKQEFRVRNINISPFGQFCKLLVWYVISPCSMHAGVKSENLWGPPTIYPQQLLYLVKVSLHLAFINFLFQWNEIHRFICQSSELVQIWGLYKLQLVQSLLLAKKSNFMICLILIIFW